MAVAHWFDQYTRQGSQKLRTCERARTPSAIRGNDVMQKTRMCFALMIMAIYVVCAQPGSAQLTTGKIVGTVKDSSGAVVPKVLIKAQNTETKITRDTVSSDAGTYEILLLPPGQYELSAELAKFKRSVRRSVTVEVNQESRVDVELQIGVLSQTVEIAEEAIKVQS